MEHNHPDVTQSIKGNYKQDPIKFNKRVLTDIEGSPGGILLDQSLISRLEDGCQELGLPFLSVLGPVLRLFQSHLGAKSTNKARRPLPAEARRS